MHQFPNNTLKLLVLLLCLFQASAIAQDVTVSPYSLFGIGEKYTQGAQFSRDLAGSGIALAPENYVLSINPASYSKLQLVNWEVSAFHNSVRLSEGDNALQLNNFNFSHANMGFKVAEGVGVAFGLQPYAHKGYDINFKERDEYFPELGDTIAINESLSSQGGVNQIFLGTGFDLASGLSLGVNFSYLFGSYTETETIATENDVYKNIQTFTETQIQDFKIDLGMQYSYAIDEEKQLTIGATWQGSNTLNGEEERLKFRYNQDGFGNTGNPIDDPIDTLSLFSGTVSSIVDPSSVGVALALTSGQDWAVTAEIQHTRWEESTAPTLTGIRFQNATRYSLGGYIIPNSGDIRSAWKRIQYRAGVSYNPGYLEVSNTQGTALVPEFGINFGFSIPTRKTNSSLQVGFHYGQRGNKSKGQIVEQFFKTNITLTLRDKWFLKRKID